MVGGGEARLPPLLAPQDLDSDRIVEVCSLSIKILKRYIYLFFRKVYMKNKKKYSFLSFRFVKIVKNIYTRSNKKEIHKKGKVQKRCQNTL